jgi:polyketide synthase PksN
MEGDLKTMGHKLLGIDKNQLFADNNQSIEVEDISSKEIAVIGMAGRFADVSNIEEFWEALQAGKDLIREYPVSRRIDSDRMLDFWGNARQSGIEFQYSEGAYLKEIDQFDPQLFNISPTEANLMDPNQRIFVETVWAALEDAGYGGNKLSGSKTGVFVGHSCDFGYDYRYFIQLAASSQAGFSVPGNIQSIIASRIAYLLDFKGPSILVNTACSSALTAIHLACRSIRSRECDLAVAGGVKVNLAPLKPDGNEAGIRVVSLEGRAKTFDDTSDGTGIGEGAGAVLLKPLKRALLDGDQIYAVIKGSAVNQDGNSIGITAPNAAAQEEVILQAWQDADVAPETISYIEAHGTGTKLGDPIEISGIHKAFRHYTDKKQFCAVASVKTNVGHLDHAAGIVAFIKAVLALKNRQIPPSLYFGTPNRKINFTESPVYVNDRLRNWEVNSSPRRCGVSSFGLSGTNCHLVLEEAPAASVSRAKSNDAEVRLLALSAKNDDSLRELVKRYRQIIARDTGNGLDDLCYTANTGRGHYEHRLAIVFSNAEELREKITGITGRALSANPDQGVFYRHFKVVGAPKTKLMDDEISENQRQSLSREAERLVSQLVTAADTEKGDSFRRLGEIYVTGADVPWEELYRGHQYQKMSLPVYPFRRKRYWCEPEPALSGINPGFINRSPAIHPLLESCLAESLGIEIYYTRFSPERHWVLSEHQVAGNYVVPGTTYLEMASEIGWRHYPGMALELRDVFFMTPLAVNEDETREVQTVIRLEKDHCGFTIISRTDDGNDWVTHAEGKIYGFKPPVQPVSEFAKILAEFRTNGRYQTEGLEPSGGAIETGPRWDSLREIYFNEQRALAIFELGLEFAPDLSVYKLHPAIMDRAVNIGIASSNDGLYLPFSYPGLTVYQPISGKVYSYVRKNTNTTGNQETLSFDIDIWDETGALIAQAVNYIIKKVPANSLTKHPVAGREHYFDIGWIEKPLNMENQNILSGATLIFHDEQGIGAAICRRLKDAGSEVIEVNLGPDYRQAAANQFTISGEPDDYRQLCGVIQGRGISRIIHLLSLTKKQAMDNATSFETLQKRGLESLFHLTRGLVQNKISGPLSLILIADCAYPVTGDEANLNPLHAAFFGLGKVVSQEHEHLQCRCIDIDDPVNLETLWAEITTGADYRVSYRKGNRYVEEFRPLNLQQFPSRMAEINDQGVYVITGGTGGLGLEIGKYLASKHKVNLCLMNRSPFPEREAWPEILHRNDDQKLCRKIEAIQAMEANGSEVCLYAADVSASESLQGIFSALRTKYGRINGIIHCAGVAGDGFIFHKEPQRFEQVLNPKIKGTWVLDQLTQDDPLDFMVLFSSMNAFTGGPGQGDYAAANAFLDSFAADRHHKGFRTLAINWPAWKETGMAVNYGVQNMVGIFKPISTQAALQAFDEILQWDTARVIVGELDYQTIAAQQAGLKFAFAPGLAATIWRKAGGKAGTPHPEKRKTSAEIVIKGKNPSDFNELERNIARIWSDVLGLEEVNINDNFSQLGGDSILATRLLKVLEQEYAGLVDITDIFTYNTISEMAAYLDRKLHPEIKPKANINHEAELDRILAGLASGEITADEAERLINLRGDQE